MAPEEIICDRSSDPILVRPFVTGMGTEDNVSLNALLLQVL